MVTILGVGKKILYVCSIEQKLIYMEAMAETTSEPKKRISRTARWAMAHPFMIYEVTDPELRSQLCYYRNKDKEDKALQDTNQTAILS
ncbi:MAG: hypothetical protein J6Z01_11310 [Bacteroidales bacterium]|nr:hypothetical protein [Bacteroidales bacterium]